MTHEDEPNARNGALRKDETHRYLSTYCLHEEHGQCRLYCKVCEEECVCDCHAE